VAATPLQPSDLHTPTWLRLRAHLTARLDELRVQLEKDSPPDVTARLRGRIAEVKELLALQAPATSPDPALAALGMVGESPDRNP